MQEEEITNLQSPQWSRENETSISVAGTLPQVQSRTFNKDALEASATVAFSSLRAIARILVRIDVDGIDWLRVRAVALVAFIDNLKATVNPL